LWLQNTPFTSDTIAGSEPLGIGSVWFYLFSIPYECLFFQALFPFSPVSAVLPGISYEKVRLDIKAYEKQTGAEPAIDIIRARQKEAVEKAEQAKRIPNPLTPEQDALVLCLANEGKTQLEIIAETGITRSRVERSLKRQRGLIKHKPKNVDAYVLNIWRGLVEAGCTQEQAAKQLGYTQMAVSHALKRRKDKSA
jgi:hypothetical protein